MTVDGLYEFIYDWIVLSVDNTIPVILGEQDSPIPRTGVYLVIHQPYGLNAFGNVAKSGLTITTETIPGEEGEPDTEVDVARRTHTAVYSVVVSIEEVRGRGQYLAELITELEFETVQNHFRSNRVGFLRAENIVQSSSNINGNWYNSATLDVQLTFAVEAIEVSNWIDIISAGGSVPGKEGALEIEQII